jgi:hypothetical protein
MGSYNYPRTLRLTVPDTRDPERQVATKLPESLIKKLDERAAQHDRDRAGELRAIVKEALKDGAP